MRYSLLMLLCLWKCFFVFADTTNSITQWGITWQFQSNHEYGTFANGDYWVIGPVTLTNMTPAWDGTNNGWEINPTVRYNQGFRNDARYTNTLRPEMPFTISSNASLVKTITVDVDSDGSYVRTAAVLTVLSDALPQDGTNYFRPPYVGTNKALYLVSDLQTNLLPLYAATSNTITLASVVTDFSKCLRMDHHSTVPRWYRPKGAMAGYQPGNTVDLNEAMLRLMLNDSYEDKREALILFTQHSLDRAYAAYYGYRALDDGHNPNHRVVAAWAATLLDITEIKNLLSVSNGFHEDLVIYAGLNKVLWGATNGGYAYVEAAYWGYIMTGSGSKSMADPYAFIDGGELGPVGASYQNIVSQSLKGQALIYSLFPQLTNCIPEVRYTNLWNYSERWVTNGVWALPDPAAPYDGNGTNNYGITFGPDGLGGYIAGAGRFTDHHGANTDGGQYKSDFVAAMWNTYVTNGSPSSASQRMKSTGKITIKGKMRIP